MAKTDIYSDAAYFGRFMINVSALLAIITSIVLLVMGVALFFQRNTQTVSTVGTIAGVDCKPLQSGLKRCTLLVNYLVNGKMHQLQAESDSTKVYTQGSQLTVRYDPDRPEDATIESTPRVMSLRFILAAVVLFLVTSVIVWLSRRYKFFSAAYGVGEVVGLLL